MGFLTGKLNPRTRPSPLEFILLDCRGLNDISSAVLGAIMGLIETVREHGGDILLCSLQKNVFEIFDTLGFTQLYRVFASEGEALQRLNGKD